jgi:hypothetical protein
LGEAGKQVQMMNQILGEAGRFRRCEFRQGWTGFNFGVIKTYYSIQLSSIIHSWGFMDDLGWLRHIQLSIAGDFSADRQ